ncbi:MAG: hypothetical protein HYR73_07745 [Candidatus Eisenbacteria bacterium]|nr:hypothetical protein [Candidatus Eisenbacteria bacterium]
MKLPRPTSKRSFSALAALVLLFGSGGCFNPFDPRLANLAGISKPAPLPNSETGVIYLFQWCWRNRAYDEYQEIFTDDYRFDFAAGDTAGNLYREVPWRRTDELTTAQHLFVVGTPSNPPATNVTLDFTQDLSVDIDPRAGKGNTRFHRYITAQVDLHVYIPDGSYEVRGPVYFYVIRGDSAIIPPELIRRGFRADSTRWWIERWVDGTLGTGAFAVTRPPSTHAVPAGVKDVPVPLTFGKLKVLYRQDTAPAY